ncbi:undecaprenyl-diphosphate phosphatase [Zhaonella formicivorans]|uniref:undecaprenyl-diphosphate phosphatase n=1 Tax=Zhaonella formicivorans TaxID=2528593 RepID=UPI003BF60A6C
MLSIFQALILGFVQGLTEFLPISSSGHLVLLQRLFKIQEASLAFDVIVHFGTLIAVIIFFWSDLIAIVKKPFDKLSVLLVVGTIPTALIGLAFGNFFEQVFHTGQSLGIEFFITGVTLWLAESLRSGSKVLKETSVFDAAFIGTMQGVAILPAISRSGLTIAGALFRGLDRKFAARFSFLLSIPAILGATVLEGKDLFTAGLTGNALWPLLVGAFAAALAGYVAIKFMLKILEKGTLKIFSYYVFLLGALVLVDQLFFNLFFPPLF